MKKYLLCKLFLVVFAVGMTAQHDHQGPCGTPSYKSEWLKKYQLHPEAYAVERNELIYVPIAVNIVGDDNGGLFFNGIGIQNALCTLNKDFEEAKIKFYLGKPIRYITDSRYARHDNVAEGYAMMQQYDEPTMINCYFMQDAAGNCGYNLPAAGMCVSINCARPDDHTWAHEMGHQLALPHPFLGWEGGVSWDGSEAHDFNDPAPETVTYNYTSFKETWYTDTLIIDTAFVEKMDGSNCSIAADGFCDTKPDYLAARWACNADLISITEQTDPNGVKFFSDGDLIMSYANDNCSSRFTPEQIAAMRAKLMDSKAHVLGFEDPQPLIEATALTRMNPTDLEPIFPQDIELVWDEVENAKYYLVQLSIVESFGVVIYDSIVTSNALTIDELQFDNRDHYWRVKVFTDYEFCSDWLEGSGSFTPDESVGAHEAIAKDWKLYPTVLERGAELYLLASKNLIKKV